MSTYEENRKHIEDYLDVFFNNKFGFAILLDGTWGSGKTFFIKKYLSKRNWINLFFFFLSKPLNLIISFIRWYTRPCKKIYGRFLRKLMYSVLYFLKKINFFLSNPNWTYMYRMRCSYISLFGISEIKELDSKIFKMNIFYIFICIILTVILIMAFWAVNYYEYNHTVLSSVIPILGIITFVFGYNLLTHGAPSFIKNKFRPSEIILDDLERCDINLLNLFGYINTLVEHENVKVLFIGDISRIEKNQKIEEIKEKLIGHTLFFKNYDIDLIKIVKCFSENSLKDFLGDDVNAIPLIFEDVRDENIDSQEKSSYNLRVIKQGLLDVNLIWNKMREQFKDKGLFLKFLEKYLKIHYSLSINRINTGEIKDIFSGKRDQSIENKIQRCLISKDNILADDWICDVFIRGIFPNFSESLKNSLISEVSIKDNVVSWRNLRNWTSFKSENEFKKAFNDLRKEKNEFKILEISDIKTIMVIHYMLKPIFEQKKFFPKDIIDYLKEYLKSLFEKNIHIKNIPEKWANLDDSIIENELFVYDSRSPSDFVKQIKRFMNEIIPLIKADQLLVHKESFEKYILSISDIGDFWNNFNWTELKFPANNEMVELFYQKLLESKLNSLSDLPFKITKTNKVFYKKLLPEIENYLNVSTNNDLVRKYYLKKISEKIRNL